MKTIHKFLFATAIGVLSVSANSYAAMPSCAAQAFSNLPQEMSWRKDTTITSQSGEVARTSVAREAEIVKRHEIMLDEILGRGRSNDTPPMFLFAEEGVKANYLHITKGDTMFPTRIAISGIGPSGILKATVLLPASGHTGAANAYKYSKTDTYSMKEDYSSDPEAKNWQSLNSTDGTEVFLKPLVTDVKSTDLIMKQELEIHMKKGVGTRIIYYRSGSTGPLGYYDGRIIEMTWDGT